MDPTTRGDITRLLHAHRDGDREAFDRLVPIVYEELRRLARSQLRKVPKGQTLDTAGLVHEAYLRLVEDAEVDWQDRRHFFGVIARAMRWVAVDHARRATAEKRGGRQRPVTLEPELVSAEQHAGLVLDVHEAVETLASFNERLALVVECRFFAGMTEAEIARNLGVTERTVQRDWRRARAWLQKALEEKTGGEPSSESRVAD